MSQEYEVGSEEWCAHKLRKSAFNPVFMKVAIENGLNVYILRAYIDHLERKRLIKKEKDNIK